MNLLCLILAASPNTKGKRCAVGVGEWWKGGVVCHEMISWWGGTVKMIEGRKKTEVRRLNSWLFSRLAGTQRSAYWAGLLEGLREVEHDMSHRHWLTDESCLPSNCWLKFRTEATEQASLLSTADRSLWLSDSRRSVEGQRSYSN